MLSPQFSDRAILLDLTVLQRAEIRPVFDDTNLDDVYRQHRCQVLLHRYFPECPIRQIGHPALQQFDR